MSTFQYDGNTYDEEDLLPVGDRVNPEAIADGLMKEITVDLNGEERHLPLFTAAGADQIKAEYEAGVRGWEAIQPGESKALDTVIITDEDGMPIGSMDVDKIQGDGMNLAFTLAAHCGDEAKTEQILSEHVMRHGTQGIGYVLIAAIKHMTNDILAGAFDFMEATPGLKPREKMAEIGALEDTPAGTWA